MHKVIPRTEGPTVSGSFMYFPSIHIRAAHTTGDLYWGENMGGGGMLCADSALMSPDPRFSLERWLGRELEFQPERGWQERVRFFLEKLVLCTYHSAAERGISSALYP